MAWDLRRAGGGKAIAVSDERAGESIASLAAAAGLAAEEFDLWASDVVEGIGPMGERLIKQAGIPNVIVAYWAGNLGAIGRWWVDWNANVKKMRKRGFLVDELFSTGAVLEYQTALNTRQNAGELHGTYFWGHGFSPDMRHKTCSRGGLVNRNKTRTLSFQEYHSRYHLAFAYVFACHSSHGAEAILAMDWRGFEGVLVPWNPWSRLWKWN
ncbi:MAG: hypothetical protein IKS83_01310 [Victivallales bacterium]|nr:hypothetical protein [Victivallales bacterium]